MHQAPVAPAISIGPAALKFAQGINRIRQFARSIPRESARRVTIALRQHRLLAQLGASAAWQIAVLPSDINGLVEQILVVETDAIRWGGRPPRKYRTRGLAILDGDWDTCCKEPIEAHLRADVMGRSVHELFVEGRPYNEVMQYFQMVEHLKRGESVKGCTSMYDIHAYFDRLHRAYSMIKAEGYKSQVELGTGRLYDEIKVLVDRNGELHKQQGSGYHRLAIARLLQVKHVPVCVLGVHRQWVEHCHRRFGGDVVSALQRGLAGLSKASWSSVSSGRTRLETSSLSQGGHSR